MFWIIAEVAIEVGVFVYSKYQQATAQSQATQEALPDTALPLAQEGIPIPLFYGRVKQRGGNVIWRGQLQTTPVYEEVPIPLVGVSLRGPISAYQYAVAFQVALGIPGGQHAVVRAAYVNDKFMGFSLNGHTNIDQVFFGSAWASLCAFYGGDLNDLPNAQNGGHFGWVQAWAADPSQPDTTLLPNYKGIATVAFYSPDGSGWLLGMAPQPDAYAFELIADTAGAIDPGASLGPYLGAINEGDANPANVLWDLLTNPWGRGGLPTTLFHAQSFVDAGQVLAAEKLGFSSILTDARTLREAVKMVLDQIDGGLYLDPVDKLVHLKLVRNDYTVGSLPVFDESNVVAVDSKTTSTWEETYNRVFVSYLDRVAQYTPRTVVEVDPANINSQGKVRTLELSFPGVSNGVVAQQLAYRELRAVSRPLQKVKLRANRDAYTLRPGGVFVLNWSKYNISGLVLRIARIDFGTLEDGEISIDATEDVFAVGGGVLSFPVHPIQVPNFATPITTRTVDEAPRWLQYHAQQNAEIPTVDDQHLWFLSTPGVYDVNVTPQISVDGGTTYQDDAAQHPAFPVRATLAANYSRALDPYDTSTGIKITGLSDVAQFVNAPGSGSIQFDGINLARLGDEIIGFETVTDNGDGTYQLGNVWRGLLDTAPVDHVANETLYVLSRVPWGLRPHRLSNLTFKAGTLAVPQPDVYVRMLPADAHYRLAAADQPVDVITIGRGEGATRVSRAPRVADLRIAGRGLTTSKTPAALTVDATDATFFTRDRLKTTITRGDATDEMLEGDVAWQVRGQKLGNAGLSNTLLASYTQGTIGSVAGVRAGWVSLARAGHGSIAYSVRTINTAGASWQDPAITIVAYHWRNLVRHGDFAENSLSQWATVTGTPTIGTSSPLETGGHYVTDGGNGANMEITQTIDVAGYQADGMSALLYWYAKNLNGDTDDTVTMTIEALDSAGAHLGTNATSTVTPSTTTWGRSELSYAALPAGTAKIKVNVKCTGVPGSGSDATALDPDSAVTGICLRLGQPTAELLTNGGFESGTTGSWTTVAGTFTVNSTNKFEGVDYVTCTVAGTLRQDVVIPAGSEYGTAVLECGRGQDNSVGSAPDWPGEVKLIALDVSNNVLATATTGSETISGGSGAWAKRLLALDLPALTAKVRVDFVVTTGTNHKATADDFRLRVWKHLDPDAQVDRRFDTLWTQPLPSDAVEFGVAFPTVTPTPDYVWDGTTARPTYGNLEMTAGAHAKIDAKCIGPWSNATIDTSCIEFPADASAEDVIAYANTDVMNFPTATSFSVVAVIKMDGESNAGHARGILGRLSAASGHGWSLELDAGSFAAKAVLGGATSTKSIIGNVALTDGAPHQIAIVYDAVANLLHCIDENGTDHSISTVGMGEISVAGEMFRLGRANGSQTTFRGQIVRTYVWTSTALSAASVAALWKFGKDPTGAITSLDRPGVLGVSAGGDNDGETLAVYAPTQTAIGYSQALTTDGGNGLGLVVQDNLQNLAPTFDMSNGTYWAAGAGAQLTQWQQGPDGFYNATQIHHTGGGASTDYFELSGITLGAGNPTVTWFYRNPAGTNLTVKVELCSSAGAVIDTYSFGMGVRTTWIKASHQFTWTNPTATAKLRFYATAGGVTGDIYISPKMFIGQLGAAGSAQVTPIAIALDNANGSVGLVGAWSRPTTTEAFTAQMNSEGEIYVELAMTAAAPIAGSMANVWNGTNSNDRRWLRVGATAGTACRFDHYAGDATVVTAGTTVASYSAAVTAQRGRWCRAGLLEAHAVMSQAFNAAGSAAGRVAAWSPGATAPTKLDIGHAAGADAMTGLVRRVRVSARERNVIAYTG